MKKFLTACIALCLLVCASLSALAAPQPVVDAADLFTAAEEAQLTGMIEAFRSETGMDFVIATSSQAHNSTQQRVADDLYDRGGYGLGENSSGILYYIDMYERIPYLSTAGDMINYMTDERIEAAHESSYSYLGSGNYAQAAAVMIESVRDYVRRGIPEGQYQYDIITGERLTAGHKALTGSELLVCALIGLVAALLFVMNVQGRYNLKGSTYEYAFRANADVELTDTQDQYLRTTTTRTVKSTPPPSSGGGSSSRPGGSGVHRSSSGRSHGGGGGRRF